jgi:hypothetical protein
MGTADQGGSGFGGKPSYPAHGVPRSVAGGPRPPQVVGQGTAQLGPIPEAVRVGADLDPELRPVLGRRVAVGEGQGGHDRRLALAWRLPAPPR